MAKAPTMRGMKPHKPAKGASPMMQPAPGPVSGALKGAQKQTLAPFKSDRGVFKMKG